MIYLPVSVLLFLILLLSLPFLVLALTFDVVTVSAAKLGFAPGVALFLLILIFIGGTLNIPLYRTESIVEDPAMKRFHDFWGEQYWGFPIHHVRQTSIVALNVGGGLIPVLLALYQFTQAPFLPIIAVTAIVTTVSYYASQIVPGIGIQINPLLPPITAAVTASLLVPHAAPRSLRRRRPRHPDRSRPPPPPRTQLPRHHEHRRRRSLRRHRPLRPLLLTTQLVQADFDRSYHSVKTLQSA